jgi:inorganic pyrophosphatase
VLAVIEIPAGSTEKWEMNKSRPGFLEWERETDAEGNESLRNIRYLPYPFNYGALPGTMAARDEGGDCDPLDVVVLGPALTAGATVAVRALGRLAMIDHGELDDKILAVTVDDPLYKDIETLEDLNRHFPGITLIIETWFKNYKGPDSDVTGLVWRSGPAF